MGLCYGRLRCFNFFFFKSGWISSGKLIRTARVIGEVHSELQSPMFEMGSELARIVFNCSVTCNLTGVSPKLGPGEHLAKIQDCNLIFQVLDVNGTVVEQVNCTRPKGQYSFMHDTKRDGRIINHVHSLKKGRYSFRYKISFENVELQKLLSLNLSTQFQLNRLITCSILPQMGFPSRGWFTSAFNSIWGQALQYKCSWGNIWRSSGLHRMPSRVPEYTRQYWLYNLSKWNSKFAWLRQMHAMWRWLLCIPGTAHV